MNKKEILEKVQVVYEFLNEDLQFLQLKYEESRKTEDKIRISKVSSVFKKLDDLRNVLEGDLRPQ